MLYSYEAKDSIGQTVTGSLEAPNERVAAQQIQSRGYFVMRILPVKGAAVASVTTVNGYQQAPPVNTVTWSPAKRTIGQILLHRIIYPVWTGVPLRDIAVLYRQFSALINAGVPMYHGITTLVQQTGNQKLCRCLRVMAADIEAGGQLSEAMARYPWIFLDHHRSMIIAGEESGQLDIMLVRLSESLEREWALRNYIKSETTMPLITLGAVFLLPPLVLLYFGFVYAYFKAAVLPLLMFWAFVGFINVLCRLLAQFKVFYDGLIASLPAIGGAVRMIAIARFCRVLSSLYSAGVNITKCISFAASAGGNAYLEKRIVRSIPFLEQGDSVVQALGRTFIFPPLVMSMLGTGEETGSLDQIMDKVADYYEQESKFRLHQLCVALSTTVLLIVAVRVFIIVLQFYTGYFNNLSNIDDSSII